MTRETPSSASRNSPNSGQARRRVDNGAIAISERVYQALWDDIVFIRLLPGSELDEMSLVGRFKASRTPIREALVRLASEGLVNIQRNRGAHVAELRVAEMQAFFESVHLVQRAITRCAAERWVATELELLQSAMQRFADRAGTGDLAEAMALNYDIHHQIAIMAKNRYLAGLYNRLLADEIRILLLHAQELSWKDTELRMRLAQSVEEHAAIFDAIVMRDVELADRLAGEHLKLIRTRMFAFTTGEIRISI